MSSNSDSSSHLYGITHEPLKSRKGLEQQDIPERVRAALRADIDSRLETLGGVNINPTIKSPKAEPTITSASTLPTTLGNILTSQPETAGTTRDSDRVDDLLANIMETQRNRFYPQPDYIATGDLNSSFADQYREINASPSVSGSYAAHDTSANESSSSNSKADPEKKRLQEQLEAMKAHLARLEADQAREKNAKNPFNLAPPFSFDSTNPDTVGQANGLGTWVRNDDTRSEMSDNTSARGFGQAASIWNNTTGTSTSNGPSYGQQESTSSSSSMPYNQWGMTNNRLWPANGYGQGPGLQNQSQRVFSAQNLGQMEGLGPLGNDLDAFHAGLQQRRSNPQLGSINSVGLFGQGQGQMGQMNNTNQYPQLGPLNNLAQMPQFNQNASSAFSQRRPSFIAPFNNPMAATQQSLNPPGQNGTLNVYQPRPIGTPLSPTATEFNSMNPTPWNPTTPTPPPQTYFANAEPVNYRRLLDRSATCDWKYIVDKIICSNDQQASIFLQQKLKLGTDDQRFTIIESIVAQAYSLMTNRFGNFLVQRCFEHGTSEQIIAIGNIIRGKTLNLSMDPFGCHVIQKAFDAVPEEMKAAMVHELLRRIPETVVHRYACHVWQKLFELRWSDSPPQIMKAVNAALKGMWHEVAQGETGSLVVQNVFENCLEEDKRLCINEVLHSIDAVARGQFGNWCIQHICEHGSPADRSFAIEHVIRNATDYSMDQFASKVVEKCLKIGGPEFLESYLDRICEGRPGRPRIPLIDISSDQYGNYLIQYILTHANPHHREVVAGHVRKHMVSLRGSKYGARVGMLCSNPASSTRPGPPFVPQAPRLQIEAPHPGRYGMNFR